MMWKRLWRLGERAPTGSNGYLNTAAGAAIRCGCLVGAMLAVSAAWAQNEEPGATTVPKGAPPAASPSTGTQSSPDGNFAAKTKEMGAALLVGAGDVTYDGPDDESTAELVERIIKENSDAVIFTLGDNAYPTGSAQNFADYYMPSWGRFKERTHPVPGNHDVVTSDGQAYYDFFGAAAGDRGKGYYSYDLGSWHIIALNSEIAAFAGSEQEKWLRADLKAHAKECVLAYWHRPRFSSGPSGSALSIASLWRALYAYGADVIVSGHDHDYERFAPLDPYGKLDAIYGMRQFVVGTGGVSLYEFKTPLPYSEVRNNETYGVIEFRLREHGYDWQFVPVPGSTFEDHGSGECSSTRPK